MSLIKYARCGLGKDDEKATADKETGNEAVAGKDADNENSKPKAIDDDNVRKNCCYEITKQLS